MVFSYLYPQTGPLVRVRQQCFSKLVAFCFMFKEEERERRRKRKQKPCEILFLRYMTLKQIIPIHELHNLTTLQKLLQHFQNTRNLIEHGNRLATYRRKVYFQVSRETATSGQEGYYQKASQISPTFLPNSQINDRRLGFKLKFQYFQNFAVKAKTHKLGDSVQFHLSLLNEYLNRKYETIGA